MTTKTPLAALSVRFLQQQSGFDDARNGFYKKKTELNDIRQVIATTHDKKRAAEEQAVMDDKGWRKRFRKAKGELTPEMQGLHTQRIIKRELVNEYDGLLAELEDEQEEAMLSVCAAARRYDQKHRTILRTHSEMTLEIALDKASSLIRAVALRLHAQSRLGHDEEQFQNNNLCARDPRGVVMQEIMQALMERAGSYQLSAEGDPILEAIGLYGPDFSGIDQRLINSPAALTKLSVEIAERKKAKAAEEE
ncbi:Uncharacterised protein [Serratia liquefaciens]|uniref:hypothetical protein n=1 Tax=Serratia liquefaciens TaxID=614 RepID=UPI002182E00F|nr:hypothetical protein [Serratia liquefaciens]CAI2515901.1 Uncharacterised protein [Serratia liquefaciens]